MASASAAAAAQLIATVEPPTPLKASKSVNTISVVVESGSGSGSGNDQALLKPEADAAVTTTTTTTTTSNNNNNNNSGGNRLLQVNHHHSGGGTTKKIIRTMSSVFIKHHNNHNNQQQQQDSTSPSLHKKQGSQNHLSVLSDKSSGADKSLPPRCNSFNVKISGGKSKSTLSAVNAAASLASGGENALLSPAMTPTEGLRAASPTKSNSSPKLAQKRRRFMKEETRVMLKLHVIRDKALKLDSLLKELHVVTEDFQEAEDEEERVQEAKQDAFLGKVLEIDSEVKLAKKLMLFLCRHKIMQRHFSVLSTIQEQMYPTLDISVQFFGLDWEHIFKVSCNLIQQTNEVIQLTWEANSNAEIDLVIPSNILRNLSTLEADVFSHAEAVLRGRLSRRHLETICIEQQRFQTPAVDVFHSKLMKNEKKSIADPGSNAAEEDPKRSGIGVVCSKALRGLRHKLFRTNSKHNSDDLWRLWYMGVQSMTLSVSAMAAAAEAEAGAAVEETGDSKTEKQEDSKSPQPSVEEQDKILGTCGLLQTVATPSVEARRAAAGLKLVEAEMEQLRVTDFGEAPMQKVEENEL